MSVTWVLNGSSKYEISSKEHLLQLMTQGTLYADTGSPPADYWDGDYEQTVDIDLETDANIVPIGVSGDTFSGTYDGSEFAISNWSYLSTGVHVGLFGNTSGATLENIRLKGVWTISDSSNAAGFLVGSASSSTIRNIDCVFDEGTAITVTTIGSCGGIIGTTGFGNLYALSIGGFVDKSTSTSGNVGGVAGFIRGTNNVGLRNAAVWTNGLSGNIVGGITGELSLDSNLTYSVNAMVGDITGVSCGGIAGFTHRGGGTDPFTQIVNSMNGNITGTDYAGGIVGESYGQFGNFGPTDTMNYMTGAIISTNNTSGGIIGYARRDASHQCSISNSIVAMNGNVDEAVIGSISFTPTVSTKIETSFGMTYTAATYGSTSDTFTGTTSTTFTDLDYIPLTFSDNASNSYEYEMVFGNVGGHASYSQYTHAIVSKDDVAGPYYIDFDLTGNSTEYLTYMSIDSIVSAYTDGSLTVLDTNATIVYDYAGTTTLFNSLQSSLSVTRVGAIDVAVSIDAIPGADAYQLTYVPTSGGAPVTAHSGFTELTKVISNLDPEVEYEISLYYLPTGVSVYSLDGSKTTTTLENVAANYDLSVYGSGGDYDLSGITNLENIGDVMNDLFTSGDELSITLSDETVTTTTFVKLGETLNIPDDAVLCPFTPSSGSSQEVTLSLPDTSTQTITYNEVTDEITVGPTTYADGDVFVLNGKRITVYNM